MVIDNQPMRRFSHEVGARRSLHYTDRELPSVLSVLQQRLPDTRPKRAEISEQEAQTAGIRDFRGVPDVIGQGLLLTVDVLLPGLYPELVVISTLPLWTDLSITVAFSA